MKVRVLAFLAYYLPGYKSGGPVRTIANMVEQLGDQLDFHIVTRDRDARDVEPYPGIQVDAWNRVGKAHVFYASPRTLTLRGIARLIRETEHDVLYLNSVFDPYFTGLPLLARRLGIVPRRPWVLAPRGEFSKGALTLKSWKKKPYLFVGRWLRLFSDLTWQASSECEEADIKYALGPLARHIKVAPNLPGPLRTAVTPRSTEEGGMFRIVFLSRITPKKNLDFALRVLQRVTVPVEFNIYGIVSDQSYWRSCQELIDLLPSNVKVRYRGAVPHDHVMGVLSQHHLFFLPTRGENYGHVIYEALAAGLPVLISDQTPWKNLDKFRVGWDLPLSEIERFASIIDAQATLSPEERETQRERAREYAARVAFDQETIYKNLSLFTDLLRE